MRVAELAIFPADLATHKGVSDEDLWGSFTSHLLSVRELFLCIFFEFMKFILTLVIASEQTLALGKTLSEQAAEARAVKAQLRTRNIQATRAAKMVQARDDRLKAMEVEKEAEVKKAQELGQKAVDQAREDAKLAVEEAQDAAVLEVARIREEAKEALKKKDAEIEELKRKLEEADEDYKDLELVNQKNDDLFDYWRSRVHQHGYDQFRNRLLAANSIEDVPAESEVPPGWYGDSRPNLPGQKFTDFPPDPAPTEEAPADDQGNEVPE
jgi:hypothetical protein